MIKWTPLIFQNIIAPSSLLVDWLNDYIIIFLIFVIVLVGGLLYSLIVNKLLDITFVEWNILEFLWTILPRFLLIFIGIPSLTILYSRENSSIRDLSVKVVGHQWYWSYDYRDFDRVEFDSYLKPIRELEIGEPRLLESDNHLVLPLNYSVRIIISSSDVLHRWALPVLAIKADANPGRINILFFSSIAQPGIFYGQCREICGANHSFIPISIEITPFYNFYQWLMSFLD